MTFPPHNPSHDQPRQDQQNKQTAKPFSPALHLDKLSLQVRNWAG